MAKIFLSYSRQDVEKAEALANALESRGHDVWWDREVQGGSRFSVEIERELKDCDAVLVLWSANSVQSAWVQDEAAEGRDRGRLIPVAIDDSRPPIGFRQFQVIDLSRWNGRADAPSIEAVNSALLALTGGTAAPVSKQIPQGSRLRSPRTIGALLGAMLLVLIGWLVLNEFSGRWAAISPLRIQLAEFRALSPDVPQSAVQSLREELLDALATDSMIMASGKKADEGRASFRVDGTVRKLQNSLSFAIHLSNARTGNEIWSGSVERPSSTADVAPRQVAVLASQVLRCGLGGAATYGRPMPDDTLSHYLSYCEAFEGLDGKGPNHERAMDLARRLTKEAPDFSRAWSAFAHEAAISRQTNSLVNKDGITAEAVAAAKRALAIDKDNSEAYDALALLQPRTAFTAREKLHRKSVEVRPSDCGCEYVDYGLFLAEVGRNSDAADSFKRAHDMLPLSPDVNAIWAESLYIAERPSEAEPVARDLLTLWPDSAYAMATIVRSAFWTGQYKAALDHLASPSVPISDEERSTLKSALQALNARNPELTGRARVTLRSLAAKPSASLGMLLPALAETGGSTEALGQLEASIESGNQGAMLLLFEPYFAPVRSSPRFANMVKRYGFLDYWRQSGEKPDFCKETPAPDLCRGL
jgi:tetratricopeptide (TPR) repeat protein